MTEPTPPREAPHGDPGDAWVAGPAAAADRWETGWGGPPAQDGGWGGGWGGPGGPPPGGPAPGWGYGAGGWGGPPPPGYGPGYGPAPHVRQNRALKLGLAAAGCGVLAAAVFVVGLFTIFLGGFLLWFVSYGLGWLAVVLGVLSVFEAVRARGGQVSARVASALPAILTLVMVGPTMVRLSDNVGIGGGAFVMGDRDDEHDDDPLWAPAEPVVEEPTVVVDRAAYAMWSRLPDEACAMLVERVRSRGCEGHPHLVKEHGSPGRAEPALVERHRALVRHKPADGPVRLLRLELTGQGWRLLDLPFVGSRCVDTAKEPFNCPVATY